MSRSDHKVIAGENYSLLVIVIYVATCIRVLIVEVCNRLICSKGIRIQSQRELLMYLQLTFIYEAF